MVKRFKNDISRPEGKYQMSSEVFFDRFDKGELGDKDDYFQWSACFRCIKKKMARLRILEGDLIDGLRIS